MTTSSADEALEPIVSVVESSADADDILRRVVAALLERGYAWAGIFFVEEDELVLGPQSGTPDEARRARTPVIWQGSRVAELAVDDAPEEDRKFLERVAVLVADHCLVGWDTGGESWEP